MSRISYGVQLNHLNKSLGPTLKYYRSVVRYLVDIVLIHYDEIKDLSSNSAQQYIEHLVHCMIKGFISSLRIIQGAP